MPDVPKWVEDIAREVKIENDEYEIDNQDNRD